MLVKSRNTFRIGEYYSFEEAKDYVSSIGDDAFRKSLDLYSEHIPDSTKCILKKFKQGEEIGATDGKSLFHDVALQKPLGILCKGRAEIYSLYEVCELTAYRPIRIISPGELLGDFL